MNRRFRFSVALLVAAPLFSQLQTPFDPQVKKGKLAWFLLTETRADVARIVGLPSMVAGFGEDFLSWQYRIGDREDEEFSHHFVFRKSNGKLLSVTRNFESERDVDALFPVSESAVHEFRGDNNGRYNVRVRKLDASRLLLAMGAAKPGDPTRQIVLIRAEELRYFYPWLSDQLRISGTKAALP